MSTRAQRDRRFDEMISMAAPGARGAMVLLQELIVQAAPVCTLDTA